MRSRHEKRRERLEHFSKKADGSYEYTGEYVNAGPEADSFRKSMQLQLLAASLAAALLLAVGCWPRTGMEGCFYLLIPYAAEVILSLMQVRSVWILFREGPRQKKYIAGKHCTGLRLRAQALIILCACMLAGLIFNYVTGRFSGEGAGAILAWLSQPAVLAVYAYELSRS